MAARSRSSASKSTLELADNDGTSPSVTTQSPRRSLIISDRSGSETTFKNTDTSSQCADEAGSLILHAPTPPRGQSPLLNQDTFIKPTPLRSAPKLIFSAWLFEIIATCIALALLIAVTVILGTHNGQPNPEWSGGITLNTVVSFGSMLFRISLMVPVASSMSQLTWTWFARAQRPLYDAVRFDQASRSLSGSLKLLFTHHVK